jgi:serine protease
MRRVPRLGVALLALSSAVMLSLPSLALAEGGAAGLSHGLIVKLHELPKRSGALAQGGALPAAAAANGADRLRKIVAAAGLKAAPARAVGRSARLLDFGRPLDAAQAEQIAGRLRQHPEVQWVVPNERERRLTTPNDPLFAANAFSTGQWWLRPASGSNANVLVDRLRGVPGLQAGWGQQTGSSAAVVAVLDTGTTPHPDLDANLLQGHDFVSAVEFANDGDGRDADPADPGDWVSQADKDGNPALFGTCDVEHSTWHGTAVAGIIAAVADNGVGVAGINWNGRVLPVRVAGKCGAEVADIIDGMRWAAGLTVPGAPANANPARVVNISFGGSAACNAAYQETIDDLRTLGVVVVAAAGNEHGDVKRPASCAGVIGVAALNRDGFKASYSSFGPSIVVSAVGGDPADEGLWGTLLGDDGLLTVDNLGLQSPLAATYGRFAGTSFSAPIVAGVISLMLSVNPALTVAQIIDGVRLSARPHVQSRLMGSCSADNPGRCICTSATCGAGILDAPQALAYAANPSGYVAPAQAGALIDSADVASAVALGNDLPPNAAPVDTAASAGGGSVGPGELYCGVLAVIGLAWRGRSKPARRS